MKIKGTITGRWQSETPNFYSLEIGDWCSAHHTNRLHICHLEPPQKPKTIHVEVDFSEIERRIINIMARDRKRLDWISLYEDVREHFRKQPSIYRWNGKEITIIMDQMEMAFLRRKEEEHGESKVSL